MILAAVSSPLGFVPRVNPTVPSGNIQSCIYTLLIDPSSAPTISVGWSVDPSLAEALIQDFTLGSSKVQLVILNVASFIEQWLISIA